MIYEPFLMAHKSHCFPIKPNVLEKKPQRLSTQNEIKKNLKTVEIYSFFSKRSMNLHYQ